MYIANTYKIDCRAMIDEDTLKININDIGTLTFSDKDWTMQIGPGKNIFLQEYNRKNILKMYQFLTNFLSNSNLKYIRLIFNDDTLLLTYDGEKFINYGFEQPHIIEMIEELNRIAELGVFK